MAVRRNSLCMFTISSLLYCALFSIILVSFVHGCPPNESRALLSFKDAFSDPDGMLMSWVEGIDCCIWRDVHCDESKSGGHVTHLDIGGFQLFLNDLDTDIGSALSRLKHLKHLDFSYNDFQGISLPAAGLASLRNLSYLNIARAFFSREIPSQLGNLSSLRHLDLSSYGGGDNKQLNGSIPSSLTLPSSLQTFLLSNNSMTGTTSIQVLFAKSSSLKELELSYSGLNISFDWRPWIPPFQLETLKLRGCNIGGPIPSWISTQFEIENVDLSDADLVGNLPSWVWEFSSELRSLNLSNNHLEGPVTVCVNSISLQLQVLDLSVNELSGPLFLDVRMPGPLSLEIPLFADNKIEGPIPASLGALISLVILDLSNNQLWGEIPNFSLGELPSLQVLRLEKNHLNGQIPVGLANLFHLIILNLASNELEGEIPEEVGELARLASLRLEKNNLQGLLPPSLAQLSELQVLDIGQNNLTGNVPAWIANCSSVQVLLMRSNNFSKANSLHRSAKCPSSGSWTFLLIFGMVKSQIATSNSQPRWM